MYKLWFLCNTTPSDSYDVIHDVMKNRHLLTGMGFSETLSLDETQSITKVAGVDDAWRDYLLAMPEYSSNVVSLYDKTTHADIFDYIYTEAWYDYAE